MKENLYISVYLKEDGTPTHVFSKFECDTVSDIFFLEECMKHRDEDMC